MIKGGRNPNLVREEKPIPWWAWGVVVFTGLLGGIILAVIFRKRKNAVWLFLLGTLVQFLSSQALRGL